MIPFDEIWLSPGPFTKISIPKIRNFNPVSICGNKKLDDKYMFQKDTDYRLEIRNPKTWDIIVDVKVIDFNIQFDFALEIYERNQIFIKVDLIDDDILFENGLLEKASLVLIGRDKEKQHTYFIDNAKHMESNFTTIESEDSRLWLTQLKFCSFENVHYSWKFT